MDRQFAANYHNLYKDHWWWRAREYFILAAIEEIQRRRSTAKILDVGCGDGLFFEHLSRFGDVEGIEPDQSLLSDDGPWRNRIYASPFDSTFQPGKRYSLILMLDVVEHVRDAGNFLICALRLLDRGGTLILTVPAFPSLWTSHDDLNQHFKRYTKKTLSDMASQVGMKVLTSRYFFHWIFPLKLLLHWKESFFGAQSLVPGVPPGWINEVLLYVSLAEQKLFRYICLPFGSSMIAICEKESICHRSTRS